MVVNDFYGNRDCRSLSTHVEMGHRFHEDVFHVDLRPLEKKILCSSNFPPSSFFNHPSPPVGNDRDTNTISFWKRGLKMRIVVNSWSRNS